MAVKSARKRGGRERVLGGQVFVNALKTTLASDAGLFHPAKWGCGVGHDADIEAQHSGFQGLDKSLAARHVLGVGVPDQAVFGVVGDPHRFLLIGEGDDAEHWPEDLFSQDVAARTQTGDDSRLIKRSGPIDRVTTGQYLGPPFGRVSDQGVSLVDGIGVDQRPDLDAFLGATAYLERRYPLGDPSSELVGNGFTHDEPVRGRTRLTDVAELGEQGTLDGLTEIRILEDQEGRVATQLHGDPQDVSGRLLIELATYPG